MKPKRQFTIGERFGKLSYLGEAGTLILPCGQKNRALLCRCDCGKEKIVRMVHLTNGRIKSCGCKSEKHIDKDKKLRGSWRGMKCRVSPNHSERKYYFDKGITMFSGWKSFADFKRWAQKNGHVDGLVLDRIDNSKGYYPDNCRWVTQKENCANRDITFKVTYNGETVALTSILDRLDRSGHYNTIIRRIDRGWSAQKAIDIPIKTGNYRRG